MSNFSKGLTDHQTDSKISSLKANSKSVVSDDNNPPFIDIDTDNKVTINYFNKSVGDYVEVVTTLSPEEAQKMTEQELDNLAYSLLSGKEREVMQKYHLKSVEIVNKGSYAITGNSSVKTLDVGIFASTSGNERALHYLLSKVRKKL